jgi:flavin reductase (DIM6/NTAB) family NADH-FMN oxidoreductase RutF
MMLWVSQLFLSLTVLFLVALSNSGSASLLKSQPIPKFNVPVWSLSTLNKNGETNMNILTYATQVSIKPKPLWALSLYKGTLSHDNFIAKGWAILHLLSPEKHSVVSILGKTSGRDVNKMAGLKAAEQNLLALDVLPEIVSGGLQESKQHVNVFSDSPVILWVKRSKDHDIIDAGDHDVILCEVVECFRNSDRSAGSSSVDVVDDSIRYLETKTLRDMKII